MIKSLMLKIPSDWEDCFLKGVRLKIGVNFRMQNILANGKQWKQQTWIVNIVFCTNTRDKGLAGILPRKMFQDKWPGFLSAIADAQRRPYPYFLVAEPKDNRGNS